MTQRAFVLQPLMEIAPDCHIPVMVMPGRCYHYVRIKNWNASLHENHLHHTAKNG